LKIGIITFHFPYNCGAMLQCYALQTMLQKWGNEVVIINYKPWYHVKRYTKLVNPFEVIHERMKYMKGEKWFGVKIKMVLGGFYRSILSWMEYPRNREIEKRFLSFEKEYLDETRIYRDIHSLQKNYPKCDMYISGSDQLWNINLTEGRFDEAYFLKFGRNSIIKIAYAVGVNINKDETYKNELAHLIEGIDAIGLREKTYVETIAGLAANIPVTTTIDPTLLLEKEDYIALIQNKYITEDNYVLIYTILDESQKIVYDYAKRIAEKKKMKIIDASLYPYEPDSIIVDRRICGPLEFLAYISKARYIVTNSYHACIFAVIFSKAFLVALHSIAGNRVTELMQNLKLEDRILTDNNNVEKIDQPINYTDVFNIIESKKAASCQYLADCLSIVK